jgi:hypothetical protein
MNVVHRADDSVDEAPNSSARPAGAKSHLAVPMLAELLAEIRSPNQIEHPFDAFERDRVDIVLCLYDALFFQERKRLAELAANKQLPVLYGARDHVIAGGLMSYGISLHGNSRRLGAYRQNLQGGKAGLQCWSLLSILKRARLSA